MPNKEEDSHLGFRGQGLVEYALMLVLVAMVVLLALAVYGEALADTYCEIVYSLGDAAMELEACEAPNVTLDGAGNGQTVSSPLSLEALVQDNKGPGSIVKVDFYLNGSHLRQENVVSYCLGGGDARPCVGQPLASGTHTIRAVATDADGYTGEATITVHVP